MCVLSSPLPSFDPLRPTPIPQLLSSSLYAPFWAIHPASGNFLAWEFELKDVAGSTLALVDRNFSGFAKEIFTDAGKYVIHFGSTGHQQQQQQLAAEGAATAAPQVAAVAGPAAVVEAAPPLGAATAPSVTPMAVARTDVAVVPGTDGNQLVGG